MDPMRDSATQPNHEKPEQPDFHTVKETAKYLRLCEKQVRRLISRGDLAAYRFGTALRIKKEDIDAYAESRRIRAG
jgi:excisionase family DNA binding protein